MSQYRGSILHPTHSLCLACWKHFSRLIACNESWMQKAVKNRCSLSSYNRQIKAGFGFGLSLNWDTSSCDAMTLLAFKLRCSLWMYIVPTKGTFYAHFMFVKDKNKSNRPLQLWSGVGVPLLLNVYIYLTLCFFPLFILHLDMRDIERDFLYMHKHPQKWSPS